MFPKEENTHLDNEGNVVNRNRATRRHKLSVDNQYTKATHKIKKERLKNAPTKQQRQRAIAKARKADRESNSQIS